MNKWTAQLSLAQKLIATFLVVGLVPLAIVTGLTYRDISSRMQKAAEEDAEHVAKLKAHAVENYFEGLTRALGDVGTNPATATALAELEGAFKKYSSTDVTSVVKFYAQQFAPTYKDKTKRDLDIQPIVKTLDSSAMAAQREFIAENSHPLGKKDELLLPEHPSVYGQIHARYQEYFRAFINRHGLYDLFLVNAEGRVVYTVFKEADFATSLKSGPWASSGLAHAAEATKQLGSGSIHFEDYQSYRPSYDAPASFAATPIFSGGTYLGSLIVQLPLDKISAIAGEREGLGENGDSILVGSDHRLRSDSFRQKETHNVAAAFAPGAKVSVETPALTSAIEGKSGVLRQASFDGVEVIAYYRPVQAGTMKWFLVTELASEDVFRDLRALTILLGTLMLGAAAIILVIAIAFGRSIGRTLTAIARTLEESCGHVLGTAQTIAGASEELSSASTEQAASLEETAASLNEISSMVEKSTDNARGMADGSTKTERTAERGKLTVEKMMTSIGEMGSSTDELVRQIQNGNDRLAEIIKVIQDIGAKTRVINEIVFQTKLLSFNASVEAARAGEHGKGFAVVAEEVGNLAKMSGSAAKEISDMLEESVAKVAGITAETKANADALAARGKEKVESGTSAARECAAVFNEIAESVAEVATLAREVSSASSEQAQGVGEINKAVAQIDAATQQNASAGEASANSARELSQQAANLSAMVARLMATVQGEGAAPATAAKTVQQAQPIPKVESAPANVLKFQKKEKPAAVKTEPVGLKKASGGEIPNANHPGFEDL